MSRRQAFIAHHGIVYIRWISVSKQQNAISYCETSTHETTGYMNSICPFSHILPIVASSALSHLAFDAVDIVALVMSHHKKMQSKAPAPAKACCISLRPFSSLAYCLGVQVLITLGSH